MHQKYAAKGLVVISVELDEPDDLDARARAEKFLVDKKAAFTNLALDEPQELWIEKFGIKALPCVYLYDRRGKWIQFKTEGARDVDYAEVEKTAVKLLAE